MGEESTFEVEIGGVRTETKRNLSVVSIRVGPSRDFVGFLYPVTIL